MGGGETQTRWVEEKRRPGDGRLHAAQTRDHGLELVAAFAGEAAREASASVP